MNYTNHVEGLKIYVAHTLERMLPASIADHNPAELATSPVGAIYARNRALRDCSVSIEGRRP